MKYKYIYNSNKYLIALLLTLVGTTLLIFNAKFNQDYSGFLLISLFLILLPLLYFILFDENDIDKYKLFLLAIFPLIIYNFLYYITAGVPVGFEDVHVHLHFAESLIGPEGKIQFYPGVSNLLSYNFILLYLIANIVNIVSTLTIVTIASVLPPIINILLIVTVYFIASRLFNPHVGLIAMMLYGWEYQVLLFGQEFRTQTIGTLFLFLFLYCIIKFNLNKLELNNKILMIILVISVVVTSFIAYLNFLVILMIILCIYIVNSLIINRESSPLMIAQLLLISFTFFLFYLIFIGLGFDSITRVIEMLLRSATEELSRDPTIALSSDRVGQLIFGFYVQISYYIFWFFFIVATPIALYCTLKLKNFNVLMLLLSFYAYITLFFIFTTQYFPLNVARIYIVGNLIISIVIASFKFNIEKILIKPTIIQKFSLGLLITLIVFLLVSASVVKLPHYIIGDTYPFRNTEPIDRLPYWSGDQPSYKAQEYLDRSLTSDYQTVSHILIIKKYFMRLSYDDQLNIKYTKDRVWLLHDMFHGHPYSGRRRFPSLNSFDNYNKIYSNQDYVAFISVE